MKGPKKIAPAVLAFDDPQLRDVERKARELVGRVNDCPFLRGKLISVHFTAAGTKNIPHRLGVPAACTVVRMNYETAHNKPTFSEGDQTGVDMDNVLAVATSAACKVDLWFWPRASKTISAITGLGY